ncbi:hypothetical protein M440DRAFT_1119481 [Trichoderma longibrachiatum ATCC 18648]|uniref:Uncharacterized protein n=1 Tax=Trichoderma longibrachiatum ATCC 18648 TaxID=983965 RepID=A0A2T4CFA3_TRILO|nr:hypothetical protein M440DRAFT_1119481 [Trichoderma longibrachiatum ATCC 18648]
MLSRHAKKLSPFFIVPGQAFHKARVGFQRGRYKTTVYYFYYYIPGTTTRTRRIQPLFPFLSRHCLHNCKLPTPDTHTHFWEALWHWQYPSRYGTELSSFLTPLCLFRTCLTKPNSRRPPVTSRCVPAFAMTSGQVRDPPLLNFKLPSAAQSLSFLLPCLLS